MAGLTKEQRAERAAGKLATALVTNTPAPQAPQLVVMVTNFMEFPGAPTTADVHPDEVENWKAHGWKEKE
ncbi:hypothetical protein [Klebsiella pasteurii]|uniref:hypothetical protein n=1 Tax=Klebsiella pasteurii TaxID=2587529 RepID=UPI00115A76DE|nr:hypothetical protein [Klebsiella pasteurii]